MLVKYAVYMPSKNLVKKFVPDGVYHIYNRGVEKRSIFVDAQDYRVFLNLINLILSPKNTLDLADIRIQNKSDSVNLLAYCLMPNHFHLTIKQLNETGMTEFMRSITNAYVAYFNKRYKRVGSLFQGTYKAALIDKDEYLVHVTRYIHMNPLEINSKLKEYPYSSYKYYVNDNKPNWLDTTIVLEQFKNSKEYEKFVNDHKIDSLQTIKSLTLD